MTARERAEALRVALMKNMESRKGFHRVDIDRETIAEWDGEWDSLIATALADERRMVCEEAAKEFDRLFSATNTRIDHVRDYRVDKFYEWCCAKAQAGKEG